MSQKFVFAAMSIPVILIFSIEALWPSSPLSGTEVKHNYAFFRDLVLLNNIHVAISYFLYFKIKEFRELFVAPQMFYALLGIGLFATIFTATGLTWFFVVVLAAAHAYLQSTGIFLLYFCQPRWRQPVKVAAWVFLIGSILVSSGQLHLSHMTLYVLATVSLGFFGFCARSWIGLLFAFRFFLWFAPTNLSGGSIGALHGIEYLWIVGPLFLDKKIHWWKIDTFLGVALVAFLAYYTIANYFQMPGLWIQGLFYFITLAHYGFDSYSFRFKFAKQRALILPLFLKSNARNEVS